MENYRAWANRFTISRVIAAWTKASPVEHSLSWSFAILLLCEIQAKVGSATHLRVRFSKAGRSAASSGPSGARPQITPSPRSSGPSRHGAKSLGSIRHWQPVFRT